MPETNNFSTQLDRPTECRWEPQTSQTRSMSRENKLDRQSACLEASETTAGSEVAPATAAEIAAPSARLRPRLAVLVDLVPEHVAAHAAAQQLAQQRADQRAAGGVEHAAVVAAAPIVA